MAACHATWRAKAHPKREAIAHEPIDVHFGEDKFAYKRGDGIGDSRGRFATAHGRAVAALPLLPSPSLEPPTPFPELASSDLVPEAPGMPGVAGVPGMPEVPETVAFGVSGIETPMSLRRRFERKHPHAVSMEEDALPFANLMDTSPCCAYGHYKPGQASTLLFPKRTCHIDGRHWAEPRLTQ